MKLFALVLSLLALSAFADEGQQLRSLAKHIQWRNLVHYKTDWKGTEASQVDGMKFFLAKDGKSSSLAELTETLRQFRADSKPLTDQSTSCRFPARYLWLKSFFPDLSADVFTACPGIREFAKKSNAQSVSLVFSSYYINTPASAFGHTFLRFNSTPHRQDNVDQGELLDYGMSYAAVRGSEPAFIYAIKGLFGLYPGVFSALPYYYKVREYNDFEFRDLWEYKLSFTQAQIDLMVAHLWELAPTYFDYLYFTENCAYHMLSLMEVGNPALKLTAQLPSLYVVPVDTVRVVTREPGLVLGARYRPSVLSRLERKGSKLSGEEVRTLRELAERPARATELMKGISDPVKRAQMLESAVDGYDFLNAKELVFRPAHTIEERHQLLAARSEVDVILPEEDLAPPREEWPDQGHYSQRWGMGAGHRDHAGAFATAAMRFALHDFLDPLPGQPTFSQIIMMDFVGTFEQSNYSRFDRFQLESFDFFHVSSMQPITEWQRNVSWDGRIGAKTIRDKGCQECFAITAEWGGGATYAPKLSESFVSLLNKFHFDYSDDFKNPLRFAVGPELWWRWIPSARLSFLAIVGYKWSNYLDDLHFADQIFTQSYELRYHLGKNWSAFLKGEEQQEDNRAGSVGLYNFF